MIELATKGNDNKGVNMKRFLKSKVVLVIGIIIFSLICCTGLYLLNRSIHVHNNDLLITYETMKPASYKEEKVNNSIYKDYSFGKDVGRVIVTNEGKEVTIRDDRHGFIKEYKNGILYYVYDLKKGKLFGEIRSYLNPGFWFGDGRVIEEKGGEFIRTTDECRQLGQLLKEKKYNQIREDKKNKIIITDKGTYFVN
jgi:hypothetical protein